MQVGQQGPGYTAAWDLRNLDIATDTLRRSYPMLLDPTLELDGQSSHPSYWFRRLIYAETWRSHSLEKVRSNDYIVHRVQAISHELAKRSRNVLESHL